MKPKNVFLSVLQHIEIVLRINYFVKFVRIFITLLFICVATIFVSAPIKYMQSFVDGLTVWAYNVLPALFPFMVLTTLATKIIPRGKFSVTKALFGISCDDIYLTSLLCGYPVGAKMIADSNTDTHTATAMCSFCSSAGPIFMIATVGAKLLRNSVATIIIVVAHIFSSVLNGLVYRNKTQHIEIVDTNSNFSPQDFGNTITNSTLSVLSVGGLIALFYMLSDMIKTFLPTNFSDSLPISFAIGLLEMTNGIIGICNLANVATATVLCSSLLAFGGTCVFLQCYAFLGQKNIKAVDVLKMKVTQSAFATILSFVLVKILL